ncbi:hypothetical protein [Rhodoflexus sp.]
MIAIKVFPPLLMLAITIAGIVLIINRLRRNTSESKVLAGIVGVVLIVLWFIWYKL